MMGNRLTKRQQIFAENVAIGQDHVTAYKNAGYNVTNEKSARSAANRLLQSVAVQQILLSMRDERNERVRAEVGAAAANTEVKERAGRVIMLIADLEATDKIIAARAKMYGKQDDIPGGETGHVAIEEKVIGAKTVHEKLVRTHSVDVAVMRERRAILDAIAMEMGQRITKPGDGARKRVQDMSAEELRDLLEELTRFGAAQERRVNATMGKPITN